MTSHVRLTLCLNEMLKHVFFSLHGVRDTACLMSHYDKFSTEENISIPRYVFLNDHQRGLKHFTDHLVASDNTHLPQARIQYNYSKNSLLSLVG